MLNSAIYLTTPFPNQPPPNTAIKPKNEFINPNPPYPDGPIVMAIYLDLIIAINTNAISEEPINAELFIKFFNFINYLKIYIKVDNSNL